MWNNGALSYTTGQPKPPTKYNHGSDRFKKTNAGTKEQTSKRRTRQRDNQYTMSFPQQNFPGSMHGGMTGPPAPKLSVNEAMSQAQRDIQQQQQQHHGHHRASNVGASDLEPTVSSSLSSSSSSSITSSSSTGNLVGPDHPIFHQNEPTDGNNHGGDKAQPSHPMSGGGTHDPERPEAHFDPYGPPKTSANRSDPNPDTTVRPKFTSDKTNIDFKF